jgi:hypothetical protein
MLSRPSPKPARRAGGTKSKAGLALLAGAAGLALKNRDKLTALLARKRSTEPEQPQSQTPDGAPPIAPVMPADPSGPPPVA